MTLEFPREFKWGISSASYQIEGAVNEDGRGPSIWDSFSHTPGKILNGHTGDVAADHYHRVAEDTEILRALGGQIYRFSLAWPRIFPDGTGTANPEGVAFYDRMVDAVLEAGIEPWVCFYHWDLPQALQDRGGWLNREIADWLTDYAVYMAGKLGDRVSTFAILNEPSVTAYRGHGIGEYAPGIADRTAFFSATHHQNLAQGAALRALRDINPDWRLGTVLNLSVAAPTTDTDADRDAASMYDLTWNRAFLDPLYHGRYPDRLMPDLEAIIAPDDLATIHQPTDYLGINFYCRSFVSADPAGPLGFNRGTPPAGIPASSMGWAATPEAFYEQLVDLRDNYGNPPVYCTENGLSCIETPDENGFIDDAERIAYIDSYLRQAHRAIADGCRFEGYFVWTLLDTFEWKWGFDHRMGMVHVDYETLKRTPKRSYGWFRDIVAANGLPD